MKIKFAPTKLPAKGALVILVDEKTGLGKFGKMADKAAKGQFSRAMKAAEFSAKAHTILEIAAPDCPGLSRVFIYGAGEKAKLAVKNAELLGGGIAGHLCKAKVKTVTVAGDLATAELDGALASGMRLRNYSFNKYKTKSSDKTPSLTAATILSDKATPARKIYAVHDAVATGVHLARDLVNEPANKLFPVEFANRAKQLTKLGVKVEVLTPAQMKRHGMGALLGVGQGSEFESRLVVMSWNGGKKGAQPIAFVGKGVTFDTGGVSIKPAGGMEDMKGDMGGAACVTGLMAALAGRKAKANVIGVIGLVENMVDGKAQRPGDVVTSMSGQTIAVLNTDAEGRLVLADALWYTQKRFKPKFMINLATLTGAILVALGKEHAGLFSNNDDLSDQIFAAGQVTDEKVWRLPLTTEYDKLIDSDIADMKNIGGRYAGSITAGQFLQRFVNDVPWAHLDIAGTAMGSPKTPINQSWSSGWGVRLLSHLVAEHYEG